MGVLRPHILLFKSVYMLKMVSPWHGPKNKPEVDLHNIPWHTTKRAGVRPAFTMHQLWAFLHDMTRLGGNLEVHLHDMPTRRGWGLEWGLPSQCTTGGSTRGISVWHDIPRRYLEVHLHGTSTRRGWGLASGLPSQCTTLRNSRGHFCMTWHD